MSLISPSNLNFLTQLAQHNDRDWFNENKSWYQSEHENTMVFADQLLALLTEVDQISTVSGKKSLMRIYRDVRFSKDKSPYNPRWAGSFNRVKPDLRGGYYFRIQPGATIVGGGFYNPNTEDIKLIRDHIAVDDQPLRDLLVSDGFRNTFGQLMGDKLKTAPKGFEKDHPALDLLKFKTMYCFRSFSDKEVLSKDFAEKVTATFLNLRPFFDLMTEYLTTDMNGISLTQK
ncbi:MAG: hypothetical protein ACJAXB_002718 [Candidatus Endobugula sp.]|jgi:uncharacterized protein (TIGR02453 family)